MKLLEFTRKKGKHHRVTRITDSDSSESNNPACSRGGYRVPGIQLPTDVKKQLEAVSRLVRKPKGAVLFRRGMASRGAYLISRGQVELSLEGGGNLYPTRLLGPGSIVGLPASFSGEPYSLTAVAVKDCELSFVSRQNLLKLLQDNTEVALQLLQILSEEIAQMRKAANAAFVSSRPNLVH